MSEQFAQAGDFFFTEGTFFIRVFAVTWEVGNEASETNGTKSLRDGEVVFLTTSVSMQQKEGSGFWDGLNFLCGKLLAEKEAFLSAGSKALTKEIGRAVGGGVIGEFHPVIGGLSHDFEVGVVQFSPLRGGDAVASDLDEDEEREDGQEKRDGEVARFHGHRK
jgi:hypothetical protein